MAQVYTTGPVDIHCIGGFLGHGEQGAKITVKPAHEGVNTDLAGSRIAHDVAYMGSEAFVSVTLTRWNEEVRQQICAYGNPIFGGVEGIDEPFDRGALLLHEGLAYPLILRFPKQALGSYATLRPGYRFLKAWLEGSTDIEAGVRPLRISLIWHCLGEYDPDTGRFILADFNLGGAGALD